MKSFILSFIIAFTIGIISLIILGSIAYVLYVLEENGAWVEKEEDK